ncbi:MAG TPA: ATP-binding protein, partial [Polyangiales bacterium]|nr:ATP-binding protein [Polyangiales bacterium]
ELTVEELPTLEGDPDRIYQLFLNVISNANKFHKPGAAPHIRVSCEHLGDRLRFCVADDGIGVDPQHQASIFRGFNRLHAQSEFEGTGLGLAICRQIVEQHGGEIWLESKPGEGSKVFFSLNGGDAS